MSGGAASLRRCGGSTSTKSSPCWNSCPVEPFSKNVISTGCDFPEDLKMSRTKNGWVFDEMSVHVKRFDQVAQKFGEQKFRVT